MLLTSPKVHGHDDPLLSGARKAEFTHHRLSEAYEQTYIPGYVSIIPVREGLNEVFHPLISFAVLLILD